MSKDSDIEKLKKRLDKVENWISEFIRMQNDLAESRVSRSADEDETFEVVSLDVKPVSGLAGKTDFAYKLQVRNLTDRRISLFGKIAFYDNEGFEMDSCPISGLVVPAGQLLMHSGKVSFLTDESPDRISDIKAVLENMG